MRSATRLWILMCFTHLVSGGRAMGGSDAVEREANDATRRVNRMCTRRGSLTRLPGDAIPLLPLPLVLVQPDACARRSGETRCRR